MRYKTHEEVSFRFHHFSPQLIQRVVSGWAFVLIESVLASAATSETMETCKGSIYGSIHEQIDEKIELGRSLIDKLERDFQEVDGAVKTKRNIDKEIKFLQKVCAKKILSRLSKIK